MTSSKSFSSHSEPNPPICEVTEEIHWLHVHFQLVFYSGHSSQTCQARRNTIRTCSQVPCNQAANSQPPSIKPDGCLPLSQYLFSFQQICLRLAICLRLFARGLLQIAITVWAWSQPGVSVLCAGWRRLSSSSLFSPRINYCWASFLNFFVFYLSITSRISRLVCG